MSSSGSDTASLRQKLIDAFERHDNEQRGARVDRELWASRHDPGYGLVVGRIEWLSLLREARNSYVQAQYVAAVLVAFAFIEHTIAEALIEHGLDKPRMALETAIATAGKNRLFPEPLLDRADELRRVRNPFAHRRPDSDPDTLGSRYLARRVHPQTVLEADAQEALQLTFAFYRHAIEGASA